MLDTGVAVGADDAEFVRFLSAGTQARGEFRCAGCGYGVAVTSTLPSCPMCAGSSWEASRWSPLPHATTELL